MSLNSSISRFVYSRSNFARVILAAVLLLPSCSARKSSGDDSPAQAPAGSQPQNSNSQNSEGAPKDNTPNSPGEKSANDSLSVVRLLKSQTINGLAHGYLLLIVNHSPTTVSEISGIKLVNKLGASKDLLADCMKSKRYYGTLTKSALEKSGYFDLDSEDDVSMINELADQAKDAKLLVVSPAPQILLSDESDDSVLVIQAKTSDGKTLEN